MSDGDHGPDGEQQERLRAMTPPRPFDAEPEPEPPPAVPEAEDEAPEPVEVIAVHAEPEASAPFEDLSELPVLLESLLFVADHPLEESYLARALDVTSTRIERALDELGETLRAGQRGIRLQRGPEGVQLVTAPEAAARIEHFLGLEASRRLSTAALETLAIIAYRQPITRGQIDSIRGVSSDGAVATLRARALIAPAGHAPGPGRPMLFQTTQRFLEHFGLERAGQLPPLPEEIDLPPAEISEQLGLAEQDVVNALAAADTAAGAAGDAGGEEDAIADDERVEIPADVHVLTEAAGAALAHLAEAALREDAGDDA
ncbi:MAG: SMC-Scp complex subunit ScpB [Dehalococcoidia bacterium]